VWDVLFLDLYHPRKSRLAPAGYRIAAGSERQALFLGANEFVAVFPDQLPDAMANTYERLIGGRMRPRQVREAVERIEFERPTDHQMKVKSVTAALEGHPYPTPLTDFCSRITDRVLQNICEEIDKHDTSKPTLILVMLISMAAFKFWSNSLKFENLDRYFTRTNSDVVVAEAMFWIYSLFAKMVTKDFDASLARTGFAAVVNEIEARTDWSAGAVGASRLQEYSDAQSADELIGAFTRKVLSSVGKQSINDEDTDGFGHFSLDDAPLFMAIGIFFTAMPSGYYKAFKNACALYCAP
jgi:hypothetical protein